MIIFFNQLKDQFVEIKSIEAFWRNWKIKLAINKKNIYNLTYDYYGITPITILINQESFFRMVRNSFKFGYAKIEQNKLAKDDQISHSNRTS